MVGFEILRAVSTSDNYQRYPFIVRSGSICRRHTTCHLNLLLYLIGTLQLYNNTTLHTYIHNTLMCTFRQLFYDVEILGACDSPQQAMLFCS
ncbi:hypothetical protein VIGAN_01356900 [Vigna angularis var. angularis]|uniref:Uncharacterized protein n=1 Tax=Vigna angularis var. angularis TaxID=157739 RepID=A0A0S3R4T2_PHAAN|nr:hypothetical protein VIGAN_01356900 [Vigna angularis var. angularis]